jgi:hypothetical protein
MPENERRNEIMATDITGKITGINEQIAQLENRRRELLQKSKAQERKARTKRLIERGALLESLIDGADELTNEQFKRLIEKMMNNDNAHRTLEETRARSGGEPTGARGKQDAQGGNNPAPKQADATRVDGTSDGGGTGVGAGEAG